MRAAEPTPEPARREVISLSERMVPLEAMRVGFILALLAAIVLDPDLARDPLRGLILPSALYGLLVLAIPLVRRLDVGRAISILEGAWLLDGVYVAWIVTRTGGIDSPLGVLAFVHVIAITLLGSYRTGLKIAGWYSLLFLVVAYAREGGILEVGAPGASGEHYLAAVVLELAALWAVALATAAFSAVNERELRRTNAYLERLTEMVDAFERRDGSRDIPGILLDSLRDVFGIERGVVLASEDGDLSLVAVAPEAELPPPAEGLDPLMERAWSLRRTVLVKALDADTDPRLASLLPDAANVMIVPMYLDRGFRLGLVIAEYPAEQGAIRRPTLAFIEQFTSRAAVALHNVWLLERVQRQLDENRALQRELARHNASLETAVEERTAELRETIGQLRTSDAQRKRLLSRLVRAEEDERRRIAGDIHDDPVQKLVAADMHIQLLRRRIADEDHAAALDKLQEIVRDAIGSLRQMLFELRPIVLDEEGISAALRQHVRAVDGDLDVEVRDELTREPSADTRLVLYRIAQEALANARKHAQARNVTIVLEERDGGFALEVSDDGVGFRAPARTPAQAGHLGLTYMRERAEMAGGSCEVRSLPGAGTVVDVWLPDEVSEAGGGDAQARDADGPVPIPEVEATRTA